MTKFKFLLYHGASSGPRKQRLSWEKIEIFVSEEGDKEIGYRIPEIEKDWNQMGSLYKTGGKQKLNQFMNDNCSVFPMMIFFGVMDIMMFSMMFSVIGSQMTDYVPAEDIPADMGDGDYADSGGLDGGDFDIGF